MTDVLEELRSRLQQTVSELRSGRLEPGETLAVIEECAGLATEAAAQIDSHVRAAVEPLPDLPGQLPLASSQA